jgi:DNA polymerase-3 subunit delta
MKLTGVEANRFLAKPDAVVAGILIFGADAMRVALKRQESIAAIIGPQGESEMRLTRLQGADIRKSPAPVLDASREIGFFSGPRVVFVEEATDGVTDSLSTVLADWRVGDAQIVVTAGDLKGKSTLKTLFEKHLKAVCIGLYNNPPTRAEIESELAKAGLTQITPAAMSDLNSLARDLDPGDFRQFLEKIALYKYQDPSALTPDEVAALAPMTIEAEATDLITAVADRKVNLIGPLLRRLEGQGVLPVTLCIGALWHFRSLHGAVTQGSGGKFYGARAEAMQRQAGQWGAARLEDVLRLLIETDLTLRSTSRAPAMAVMERAFIRISMMKSQ